MWRNWLLAITIMVVLGEFAFSDVSINGYVQTDNRFRIQEERNFTWNENRLGLKLGGNLSQKLQVFSELRLRGFGFPEVISVSDLQRQGKGGVLPWGIEMREAYMDIYGFLTEKLDIRIGRQVIVWGTADKINPTSNLCPDDLEDILEFGEKLGVNALKATYYQKVKDTDISFTGVFIPVFTPSILPPPNWASAFTSDIEPPLGMRIGNLLDRVLLPQKSWDESSSFAGKFSTKLFNFDVSLSYYYGRDKLPIVASVTLVPTDVQGTVDVTVDMKYPKVQAIGADLAGEIKAVGVWAEGAMFFPEKTDMIQTLAMPSGTLTSSSIALEDEPYLKVVVGGDYNFRSGIYVNLQYIRGFISERGKDNLNDYFVSRLEYKFHRDEVKIAPVSFAIAIDKWDDVAKNYGVAYMPEISYSPHDSMELTLGTSILGGKGKGIFSKVKDNDELYFKAKISF